MKPGIDATISLHPGGGPTVLLGVDPGTIDGREQNDDHGVVSRYAQPSCCRVIVSFQIFVMWRILSPSKSMT
jgi:hypothetical protein